MRYLTLALVIFLTTSHMTAGQMIKGRITNQSGESIPYATVYIQELKQGTTSNTKGDYEIKLPPGKYMVTYQSLGFEPVFYNAIITNQIILKDVVLPLQFYEIPEVRITASGEDPAYGIMRKAIGLAPYYLNHVSYYKASVYIKGNLVINRIPRILKKSMKIESSSRGTSISAGGEPPKKQQNNIKEGETYMMESLNEMEFTSPDKYVQKVISLQSTIPSEGDGISPMSYIEASFYEPILVDMAISPLSPQAFSHYKFKYLGASLQGNYTVNKIQVIPRRKSQQLFSGTIYIIDDLWCLHSVDLTNENLAGKVRVQQLYIPVQDDIWMPVSHQFEINIGIMGFKADAGYGSSIKYLEVRPNTTLKKPISESAQYKARYDQKDTVPTKTNEQIEKILQKDEISNRDMARLSKLMKKESDNSLPDSVKDNLEVKDNTTRIIEKDANKKDSIYWNDIRPIPLSSGELKSLRVRDSIRVELSLQQPDNDSIPQGVVKKKGKFVRSANDFAFGHAWSDTLGNRLNFGGLIDLKNLSFNTIDGFVYGINFRYNKAWKNKYDLSIYPDFRYAFSREKLMWRVNGNFRYAGIEQKMIMFRMGISSKDLNTNGSINQLLNTAATLFFKKNYLKIYESRYFGLGYKRELANGLYLELNANYDDRRVLENTTNFSLSKAKREYSNNIPGNKYLTAGSNFYNFPIDQKHGEFVTNVTYTPYQKYRISNKNKIPLGSDWPTFSLTWKHGINEFKDLPDKIKHFDAISYEINSNRDLGGFNEISWNFRSGGFINNRSVPYYDFFHFNSQSLPFLIENYMGAFMLSEYYSLSTPEFFAEAHIKYTTPYLLLKLLPVLSNTLMRENLSLSYLGARYNKNYTEIGYSLSEFMFFGMVGVYVGFEDFRYKQVGAKLVFRFN